MIDPKKTSKTAELQEEELTAFSTLKRMRHCLASLVDVDKHHNRQLDYYTYTVSLLFYYLNPILTSSRGIQRASTLGKVQKTLGIKRMSLGSLSEAPHAFDPEVLKQLYLELAERAASRPLDERLRSVGQVLTAVDGSIFPALPRMAWAFWLGEGSNGVRLNLQLDVQKDVASDLLVDALASKSETDYLSGTLEAGRLYLMDRGYANYRLFEEIMATDSSFVCRLKSNHKFTPSEARPLTDEDRAAGVRSDRIGTLGGKKNKVAQPIRIVEVYVPGKAPSGLGYAKKKTSSKNKLVRVDQGQPYTLFLATDRFDLPAEIIALLYLYRWKVESFFKMLKGLLGCRHLLSDSLKGVTIQVYCALIMALLLAETTKAKPSKAGLEIIQFYMFGFATDAEVKLALENQKTG